MSNLTKSVLKRLDTIQSEMLLIKEIAEVTGSKESEVRQQFFDIKTRNYAAGIYIFSLLLFWGSILFVKGTEVFHTANGRADFIVITIASLIFPFLTMAWRNVYRPY